MSELYLIAHIVRGEPSFDIAIKLQIGEEEGWIIPTSGHRAYPYWSESLTNLSINYETQMYESIAYNVPDPPADWPDHYEASPAPKGRGIVPASGLLERLGLLRKMSIRRR